MSTIKPIEARSVHQIQSGQVIVNLCSVVKELVENSLDAEATSIDVRFKNYGLDSIEVQDNGGGIAPEDYETIALKHYTSKLSTYDDLTSLQTFGFRGEALSSLCALSNFYIVTSRPDDAPKGTKLEFETSGKLKSTSVIASQKGTTVAVETLFKNLPVRRRELEKNIKREYSRVLGFLQAYACISVGVRYSVSNYSGKGKKVTAFSTRANTTVRENIADIYGAKTMVALLPLELKLVMEPNQLPSQSARVWSTQQDSRSREIHVVGHISRPVSGEGRLTPDRQMFFVNSRPCALPQVAKAFNEVYKSYNVSQSPFISADFRMDTNAYDVNVSPDKRTILLHDQSALLGSLKSALTQLLDSQTQTVPLSHRPVQRLPAFRQLSINREASTISEGSISSVDTPIDQEARTQSRDDGLSSSGDHPNLGSTAAGPPINLIKSFAGRNVEDRIDQQPAISRPAAANNVVNSGKGHLNPNIISKEKQRLIRKLENVNEPIQQPDLYHDAEAPPATVACSVEEYKVPRQVEDFNARIASQQAKGAKEGLPSSAVQDPASIPMVASITQRSSAGIIQNAFDRMRSKRTPAEIATITIGSTTTTSTIGSSAVKKRRIESPRQSQTSAVSPLFGRSLRAFAASGTQMHMADMANAEDEDYEMDERRGEPAECEVLDEKQRSVDHLQDSLEEPPGESDDELETGNANSTPLSLSEEQDSVNVYSSERKKKASDEVRVEQLIHEAEEASVVASESNLKRAASVLKGNARQNSTLQLLKSLRISVEQVEADLQRWTQALERFAKNRGRSPDHVGEEQAATVSPEERLSLKVSKDDFARMRVVGQFNLGFILTIRPSGVAGEDTPRAEDDELFIIDQHASDEKRNFERLQAETVVQNQPLVQPRTLDLTAIEEETILSHPNALSKNGFIIEVDNSGNSAVGRRCKLLSLPMSREVVFDTRDLEELLALLLESSSAHNPNDVPRPSKVRRMFAMRACRSSIMVGKTLTAKQMEGVVRRMGEIDKPWNCPHGRPTMRHLVGLGTWTGWKEGDRLAGMSEVGVKTDWAAYVAANGRRSGKVQTEGAETEAEEDVEGSELDSRDTQSELADTDVQE